jgi:hypothetical protein
MSVVVLEMRVALLLSVLSTLQVSWAGAHAERSYGKLSQEVHIDEMRCSLSRYLGIYQIYEEFSYRTSVGQTCYE